MSYFDQNPDGVFLLVAGVLLGLVSVIELATGQLGAAAAAAGFIPVLFAVDAVLERLQRRRDP